MTFNRFILIAFIFLTSTTLYAQSKYDLWVRNEGYYLLTPEQKEKFKSLPESEKETYISNVWAARDPNPITPENEFQIEYMKRFEYVKKHFGIPSDRAKIYLLLGAPNSVDRYPNSDKYYPLEQWSYFSLGFKELPPSLDLIFFKRWGSGDYRLYSPLFDGFKALTPSQVNLDNPRMRSQIMSQFDPPIVQAAENISTGMGPNASESVRMILTDPYAPERIEKKRPSVETTVVYQGFEADIYTYTYPYKDDLYKTSIAIAIPPRYFTFEKDQDKYSGRVDLQGRIRDEKGHEIMRINDSPAITMNDYDFEKARQYIFSYTFDAFLLPGKYSLDCIFRDYASNSAGKMEKTFEVKPLTGQLEMLPTLLAYKGVQGKADESPFTYALTQYYPKENISFNNGQSVIFYTSVQNPEKIDLNGTWKLQALLKKEGTTVLEVTEDVPVTTGTRGFDISRKVKLQSLIPGSYVFSVQMSKDRLTLTTESPLRITTDQQILGRMRVVPTPNSTPEQYHTNVALQNYFKGNYDEAAKHVRIALDFAPSSYPARSLNARIDKARGNTGGAIQAYEKLLQESPSDSEGFFLVGKWCLESQDFRKASDMMKKAINLGYYTTELLNDLGQSEMHLGNSKEAIAFWEKSLALDSNQPDIQKLVTANKKS
jgi:GWxTD domain-containing protein